MDEVRWVLRFLLFVDVVIFDDFVCLRKVFMNGVY